MKHSFFQVVVVLILLYGCTTWMLTKRIEKKLDDNYTRMLLYSHLPPFMTTIQVRRTRYAGHCWRSRDKLISDILLWTPSHGWAKARWPAWTTYSSSVLIWDVALKTCQKQWTIEKGGEKGSGISVLIPQHDDDEVSSSLKDSCQYAGWS